MKYLLLVLVFLFQPFENIYSQGTQRIPLSYVVHGEEVREVWDQWMAENQAKEHFRAWRILVAGVESRRAIDLEIQKLKKSFPEISYDWEYDPPIYKLKAGIFIDRLDAKPLLYKIKEYFPAALEIRDRVSFDEYFEGRK